MRVLCPSCCGKSIPTLWVEGRSGLSVGKGADYSIVQTLVSVLLLNENKIRRAKTSVRPRLGREQTTRIPALRDQTRRKRDRPSMSVPVGKQFAEKASRFFSPLPLGVVMCDDGMGRFSGGEITTPLPITGGGGRISSKHGDSQ